MYNSRRIEDLRTDVAENCKVFLELCKKEGLNVLITGTVRDKEYQEDCFRRGTAKTRTPSFHAQGIGLAFDFCKNIRGQEYSDKEFFKKCGAIGKMIGFEWGGDWKSFPDMPHLQWSNGGKFGSNDILNGRLPPTMKKYEVKKEGEKMEKEPNGWAKEAWEWGKEKKITDGTRPQENITREEVILMLHRYNNLAANMENK